MDVGRTRAVSAARAATARSSAAAAAADDWMSPHAIAPTTPAHEPSLAAVAAAEAGAAPEPTADAPLAMSRLPAELFARMAKEAAQPRQPAGAYRRTATPRGPRRDIIV
jgi:hypothetical protein